MLSGDNGILQRATDAKTQTGVGQEKEIVALAYNSALAKKISNGNSTSITSEDLNTELTNQGASANGDNPITVTFTESQNVYTIDANGNINKYIEPVPLTAEEMENAKGNFVKYNVPYKDAYYTDYSYTESNGWRILNIEDDGNGKYNVEIISTGIPARLFYNDPNYSDSENYRWWGTYDNIKSYYINDDLGSSNFKSSVAYDNNYRGYYAAYGLKFNFAKIIFNKNLAPDLISANGNLGFYDTLNGQNGSLDTEAKVLAAFTDSKFSGKINGIREIEASDIRNSLGKAFANAGGSITNNEDANSTGLFKLNQIKNIANHQLNTYSYVGGSDVPRYLLASSRTSSGFEANLYIIWNDGYIESTFSGFIGLRPIVSISGVSVEYDSTNDLWILK